MTLSLASRIKALPSIKDAAGAECVSREQVLLHMAATAEEWRKLGHFYEQKSYSALGDTVPTPGTVAIQCAAELVAWAAEPGGEK